MCVCVRCSGLSSFTPVLCVVCWHGSSLVKSFLPCFFLVSCSVLAALVTVCKCLWLVRLPSGGGATWPVSVSRGQTVEIFLMCLQGQ